MEETQKAGCFLIDAKKQKIALVVRESRGDVSFPKGHVENGESAEMTAVRETAEETRRIACIMEEYAPYVERYETPRGEKCVNYMFFALDGGASNNTNPDTHPTIWVDIEEVESKLTYESLKRTWRDVLPTIKEILEKIKVQKC